LLGIDVGTGALFRLAAETLMLSVLIDARNSLVGLA